MSKPVFATADYAAGDQFQREKQTLFARSWLPFAASGQMPAPGDAVGHTIGGWPLFAVRGEEGIARAFHNVCRHQSMPVVEQGPSHCAALRCRYHGWTYGFDGRLVEAPPRFAPAGPVSEIALSAVAAAEADGICFVRVAGGDERPPRLGLAATRFVAAVSTDIDANWKAAIESFLDATHRQLVFPLALVAESREGRTNVRQIVPRTFSRTRIVDLVFSDRDVDEAALSALKEQAAADKSRAEVCQARRAAGEPPATTGPAADFLGCVAAAAAEPGDQDA